MSKSTSDFSHSRVILAGIVIGVGVVWLFILPWIAKHPDFARYSESLESRHIDASAMYYSELERIDVVTSPFMNPTGETTLWTKQTAPENE